MIKDFVQKIRVRYAETDRMGYAYYGNYAAWFEVARVEMLRSFGVNYKQLEDEGVMLPVLEYRIKYFKPAFYDEELAIHISIDKIEGSRLFFSYKTFNEKGVQLNEAETTLVFVDTQTGRPTRVPAHLMDLFTGE